MIERSVDPDAGRLRRRVRFELIVSSACLAVGIFLLPAMIYTVGIALLGPYAAGSGSVRRFYADFFVDLAEPSGRVWAIALSPLVMVSLLRLAFSSRVARTPESEPETDKEDERAASTGPQRVEPRITLD
jgi:hypothetical protein